jgi:hypothetical protein
MHLSSGAWPLLLGAWSLQQHTAAAHAAQCNQQRKKLREPGLQK